MNGKPHSAVNGSTNGIPSSVSTWASPPNAKPKWKILRGDSRKLLAEMPHNQFACAITSPPYYWQRDYGVTGQIGMEKTVGEYVNSIVETMSALKPTLKQDGTLFLNLGDTYYSGKGQPQGSDEKHRARRMTMLRAVDASGLGFPKKSLLALPWRIAIAMIDAGWILRSAIVWQRPKPLPEANVLDRPWRTYEFVFMFSKARYYKFDRTRLEELEEEDVWTIDAKSVPGRTHPATFPEELVNRCLDITGIKRGHVIDPFAGSCTVIEAAAKRGLHATGIDLSKPFCEDAAARLMRLSLKKTSVMRSSLR